MTKSRELDQSVCRVFALLCPVIHGQGYVSQDYILGFPMSQGVGVGLLQEALAR